MNSPSLIDKSDQRVLRIIGRMPLASAADLAPILERSTQRTRHKLNDLRGDGLLMSVRRGMSEPPRDRWFLTPQAAESLYATDHVHPNTGEVSRARGYARLRLLKESLGEPIEPLGLDHEHVPHLEDPFESPFVPITPTEHDRRAIGHELHEHPPWTATSRGLRACMRRLCALEAIYRLAPVLLRDGRLRLPGHDDCASADMRMTDFWLMRRGGFHHARAHYGSQFWIAFTFVGLHATERVLRRKQTHRFWGVDCYLADDDRYLRIADRRFYEDPDERAEPSALVVVAIDGWAARLAHRTLVGTVPTLIYTLDGRFSEPVELNRSLDTIADPVGRRAIGSTRSYQRWQSSNRDLFAIDGTTAYRVFVAIAEFPAMTAPVLSELARSSVRTVTSVLARFSELGLIEVFDDRCYLAERGMRRAANMSRVLPAIIRSRHAYYLALRNRQHEVHHNDGVNRLVVLFAREGSSAYGGWRGEINLPNVTQVKPDLLVLVEKGPFGAGTHCIEFERSASSPAEAWHKLRSYRRCAANGRPVPLLVACETELAARNFVEGGANLPLIATHMDAALAGPLTGEETVWRSAHGAVSLHVR